VIASATCGAPPLLRELAGTNALIMLDANPALPRALEMCQELQAMSPYFVQEPTHADDIGAHATLAARIKPVPIALGEHVPNRIMFKNFMQAAEQIVQVGCTRVAGISEFLTVSLRARKFGLPVVPHVGDMGQIHQHLVLFNRIALGHEAVFLECIPHLQPHFVNPAHIENGVYVTTQAPGCSTDLKGVHPGAQVPSCSDFFRTDRTPLRHGAVLGKHDLQGAQVVASAGLRL
jgi:L-fuconate dehydratase